MRAKKHPSNGNVEKTVQAIRRVTRWRFSAQEKILTVVLQGLCGEERIAELCRREQINQNVYYPGRKHIWRPARSAWPATRSGRRRPMKSRRCAPRRCS